MTKGRLDAARLPQSYWAATAESAASTPSLKGQAVADVCIIGGGFTGLSAALHLSMAGVTTCLLEAAEPGWGASGRNGGQIIPGFKAERSELVQKLGEAAAERLFSWSGTFVDQTLDVIRRHKIECRASQPGWIQPAHSLDTLRSFRRRIEEWQSRDAPVESLGWAETAKLLGTAWYPGAVLDRRGGRLHPLSYSRGLARTAQQTGAAIHGNSPVRKVARENARWRIDTDQGHVTADKIIFCTNAYTNVGGELWPNLATSIVPILSYMVATAPIPQQLREGLLPGGHTAADLKRLTNHFRLEPDGRLLFGGRGSLTEGDDRINSAQVVARLREFFPQLKNIPLDFFWSGHVALTMDHLPHLHELAPGVWTAIGCNGRGVGMCTAMGKVLSDLLTVNDRAACPVPITDVKPIPFHGARLPAMQATVWWKGLRDRIDHSLVGSRSI